jgi:hypothetical protein
MLETDTDLFSEFSLNLYAGVQPTRGRYNGHAASAAVYGHQPDGSVYPDKNNRPPQDALVDFSYGTAVEVSYNSSSTTRPWLGLWDLWAVDSGFYWHIYNHAGAASANMVGIYAGSPSRLIGAGFSGVGIYTRPGPDAGITVMSNLRGSDNSAYYYKTVYNTIRFAWNIFAGTNADVPGYASPTLADVRTIPGIAKQFCLHGNGVTLEKLSRWQLSYSDPSRPFGAMYLPQTVISNKISRCRTDVNYYQYLRSASSGSVDIWDMWRDTTGAKTHAMVTSVHAELANYIDDWANGWGYTSCKYTTQPWLLPGPKLDRYDQLLGNEYLTASEKTKVKAGAAFFGNWLWDYDVYPLMTDPAGNITAGVSMGSPNMPGQWIGTRSGYTWFLNSHPVLSNRLSDSLPNWYQLNTNGVPNTCPHYAGSLTPQFSTAKQRTLLGHNDWGTEPRLPLFGEWHMNMLSPPDVRLGGRRMLIPDGDSEPGEMPTLIAENATTCATVNPTLSRKLMWLWLNSGKPHSDFYGSTVLRIDDDLPGQAPQLGHAGFPGYGSVLRNAWNTPQETSVHTFNGSWYRDHRHGTTDNLAIYALGAPLALAWESMYNPHPSGPYLHNMVVPESNLGMSWNADFTTFSTAYAPWEWGSETLDLFVNFSQSGAAKHRSASAVSSPNLTWTRSVRSMHPNANYPLILIKDAFSGARAGESMTYTLAQMATGAVATPAGSVTPTTRFWDVNNGSNQQYPSGGTAYNLSSGLNRFQFTGQQFYTNGGQTAVAAIDWDLYSVSPAGQQFCIGSWGHNNAGAQGAGAAYQAASGTPYEQRQYLFRLKGAGGFKTLMVPRRKGQTAPTVAQNGSTLVVTVNGETVNINDNDYSYTSTARDILSTYDASLVTAYNLSAQGGATEVVYDKSANKITLAAHGAAGLRQVGVPSGTWVVQSGSLTYNSGTGKWEMSYSGGSPAVAVLGTSTRAATPSFNPSPGTYGSAQLVTIGTATSGATIRYTTDGTTPSQTLGTIYSSPVNIAATTTLKAIAYKSGLTDSSVASGDYTILQAVAAPTFTPTAGTYDPAQSVTISSATSGASIRYTTDGSTPSSTVGTLYSGAVTISSSATLKAIAYKSGMTDSSVTSGDYTILQPVAAPTFSPAAGTYSSAQSVTIGTTTSGATIRYTTDGTTPSSTVGTVYSSAVTISSNAMLKAIAYKSGMTDSSVISGNYTINQSQANPVPMVGDALSAHANLMGNGAQTYLGQGNNTWQPAQAAPIQGNSFKWVGGSGYQVTHVGMIDFTANGKSDGLTPAQRVGDGLAWAHTGKLFALNAPGYPSWGWGQLTELASVTLAAGTTGNISDGGYAWVQLSTPVALTNNQRYWVAFNDVSGNGLGGLWGDYASRDGGMQNSASVINSNFFSQVAWAAPDPGGTGAWGVSGISTVNLKYAAVSVPSPTLTVTKAGSDLLLRWPASATGYALHSTTKLEPASWTLVPQSPQPAGTNLMVTNTITPGSRLYRLQK